MARLPRRGRVERRCAGAGHLRRVFERGVFVSGLSFLPPRPPPPRAALGEARIVCGCPPSVGCPILKKRPDAAAARVESGARPNRRRHISTPSPTPSRWPFDLRTSSPLHFKRPVEVFGSVDSTRLFTDARGCPCFPRHHLSPAHARPAPQRGAAAPAVLSPDLVALAHDLAVPPRREPPATHGDGGRGQRR